MQEALSSKSKFQINLKYHFNCNLERLQAANEIDTESEGLSVAGKAIICNYEDSLDLVNVKCSYS